MKISTRKSQIPVYKFGIILLSILLITLACDISQIPIPDLSILSTPNVEIPTIQPEPDTPPDVEIVFEILVPPGITTGDTVIIKLMDEVTGLALSSKNYEMSQVDDTHFSTSLRFVAGSIIKYRYARISSGIEIQEHQTNKEPVRYRLFNALNNSVVNDVVSQWTDNQYQGDTGRIQGQISNKSDGKPIPNILLTVGGSQALTASDGSFLIEGLPPGIHNMVAYALDGRFNTFQQGAKIAGNSTTPVQILLDPSLAVDITFNVELPPNTIPAVPIRFAGNLIQLGNTYADLAGGVSTISSRMPVLLTTPDGKATITMQLPIGADVRYLYTLGDGLWNTELNKSGEISMRQLVVPSDPAIIEDQVEAWTTPNSTPITFDITVPENTPPNDFVSIQFRPVYGWTEPIPMWKIDENRWVYILNQPLNFIDNLNYRFCRNDQCDVADDASTPGINNVGYPVKTGLFSQKIVGEVNSWSYLDPDIGAIQVATPQITPRTQNFWAGVEFAPGYHPSWSSLYPNTLDDIQQIAVNWVVLTPTWTYTRNSPPVLEIVSGQNPTWYDLTQTMSLISERGLQMVVKPNVIFDKASDEWWIDAPRDYAWWQVWFERYRNFALHHADLAAQSGAQALILGGSWVSPALPDGILSDQSPSNVPTDSDARWRLLLSEVKSHYGGPLFWSIPYQQAINNPPPFLDFVDGIYLEWSEPLAQPDVSYGSATELEKEANRVFDNGMIPFLARFNKPLVLAISYPSADGAASGCVISLDGSCIDFNQLNQPSSSLKQASVDFQEQVDLYNALLSVFYQRSWISGFVSQGYYPPVILRDTSNSIHGKPAEELLAYWFTNLFPESTP
jgi:hypothetical protein